MNRQRWWTTGCFLLTILSTTMAVASIRNQPPLKTTMRASDFLRESSKQFSSRSEGEGYGFFLGFFLFLLILGTALYWIDWFYRRRHLQGTDNPHYLFSELVRAHRLNRTEQRFLRNLAVDMDLPDPLPFFIEPKYFLAILDDDRYTHSRSMAESLLKTLFGIERKDGRTSSVAVSGIYRGATTIIKRPAEIDER